MGYLIFILLLPAGYGVMVITSILFGTFSYVQTIVVFVQLLRYLNRIKPTSILTGTSFFSVNHQVLYSITVYLVTHIATKESATDKYLVFLIVMGSILLTNFCAWSLNRMIKQSGLSLDSKELVPVETFPNFFLGKIR
jgi:hypothetical protein